MAPANKQTPGKSGPQRSIKSFFTVSPAKALIESSPGKKKVALEVGHVGAPGASLEEKKKLVVGVDSGDVKSVIKSTPGKRKATLEVGDDEAAQQNTEAVSKKKQVEVGVAAVDAEVEANGVVSEDEVTPLKRRRLRKVQEDNNSDSLVGASGRARRASVSRATPGDSPKSVIGRRLKVYWPLDKAWYAGVVKAYNASEENHVVLYDDGEEQDVDITREKVEWLSESEGVETGTDTKRHKRRRSEAADSDSESNKGNSSAGDEPAVKMAIVEEEKGGRPRRGRARRQLQCIEESDDGGGDDDDADFHVVQESSEDKESELDDDEDDEVNDPEEESDSDEKPQKKPKKAPSSSSKKPSARGAKKLSSSGSGAGEGSTVLKGFSLAKNLSGGTAFNSGRLETARGFSNDLVSSDQSPLAGEAAERFSGRDSEKFKFLGKDRKDAAGRKPIDPAYNPCTLHLPADFVKGLSGGQRQWWIFKAKHMDKVLLFKMGKFYEMFEMDAHIGAKELDLQYMKGEQPHCGFPEKNFSDNAHKLARKGFRVLVVEQTETPDQLEKRRKETGSKDKVVMREVCAVITRGTMIDGDMTHMSGEGMVMLSLVEHASETGSPLIGLCVVDASTGCFQLGQFEDDAARIRLSSVLTELRPVELIVPRGTLSSATSRVLRDCTRKPLMNELNPGDLWDSEQTLKEVLNVYSSLRTGNENVVDKDELLPKVLRHVKGLGEKGTIALTAFGACVVYLRQALLDQTLLAVGRIELLPIFNAILDDPEIKASVEQEKSGVDAAFRRIEPHMVLDGAALENLEVLENCDGGTLGTLLAKLDHCVTPFGRRLLRGWLARPLLLEESIRQRQMAVWDLKEVALDAVARFKKELAGVPDLERALARLHASSGANGRNAAKVVMYEDVGKKQVLQFTAALRGCRAMLQAAHHFDSCLLKLTSSHLRDLLTFGKGMPDMKSVIEHFETAFDWSEAEKSGRILPCEGVDNDYDAASAVISEVEGKLGAYLEEQRERFGKSSEIVYLTVGKESYQMEVPERFLAKVPRDFDVRSSRKGYRRYWSPEIKSLLQELAAGQEQRESALKDILMHLVRDFCKKNSTWLAAVQTIAEVDVLISISTASLYTEGPTCTPTFSEGGQQVPWLYAKGLRHPTVGAGLAGGYSFVPNDVNLGGDQHAPFMLLTGPNMGGKSTLLRQVCLAVILAQVGADVPAEELQLSPVDQVFVRMGARDNIMAGQSTFLVELQETATMLHSATKNSLVALDELGRGTSTSDGQAIAHAVLRGLTTEIGCRGIFSTHYHRLATEHVMDPTVALYHMGCKVACSKGGLEEVTFLYKLCPGACPKSYGVNVARLAGMPESILQRASACSVELEVSFEQKRNKPDGTLEDPTACKLLEEVDHLLDNISRDPSNLESLERLVPLWAAAKKLVAASA